MTSSHIVVRRLPRAASLVFMLFLILTRAAALDPKTTPASPAAQTGAARFEHLAINVEDPLAVAAWYTEHLGFSVLRRGPAPQYSTMIGDSTRNMALEIYHNTEHPMLEPSTIHHMAMHFAFVADSVEELRSRLEKAGATLAEAPKTSASGDRVVTLRDPWGFSLQFVRRTTPMLAFRGLYAEHYALNVEDSRAKAKWLVDQLGLVIVREGTAPSYTIFVADSANTLMLELYQNANAPKLAFSDVDYMTTHLAFTVGDVAQTKARLVKAGARVAEDMKQLPNGDTVLMLRDPWGEPLQIVKRVTPLFP